MTPLAGPGEALLLSLDDQGEVGAMAALIFHENGQVGLLRAVAVANRFRGQGGRHADEAMNMALSAAADDGFVRSHSKVTFTDLIAAGNRASQLMSARAGLTHVDDVVEYSLQVWARELELPRDVDSVELST